MFSSLSTTLASGSSPSTTTLPPASSAGLSGLRAGAIAALGIVIPVFVLAIAAVLLCAGFVDAKYPLAFL